MKRESAEALHSLVDAYERHTKILRQLGEPVDQWSTIIEHLLCIRLDDGTLQAWEDHATTIANPNYTSLVAFLQRRIRVLESMSVNHQSHTPQSPAFQHPSIRKPFSQRVAAYTIAEDQQPKCYACNQYHFLIKCPRFEEMSVSDRMRIIDANRLCQNCFRHDHYARNCQSNYSCRHCQRRHHTLLHATLNSNEASFQSSEQRSVNQPIHQSIQPSDQNNASFSSSTYTCTNIVSESRIPAPSSNSNVLLSTVVLLILDSKGDAHPARALLDSGSQSNIMSERLCQILKPQRRRVNARVYGVSESASNVKYSVHSTIRSRKNDFEIDLDFLVFPRITIDLPAATFPASNWRIPQNIDLADPNFNQSGVIDLLLGAEHFYTFVNPGIKIEQNQMHTLVESVFGWIVTGRNELTEACQATTCHVSVSEPDSVPISYMAHHPTVKISKQQVTVAATQTGPTVNEIVHRTSSCQQLMRVASYCLRLINQCQGPMSSNEPRGIIEHTAEALSEPLQIRGMGKGKLVTTAFHLRMLNSFLDSIRTNQPEGKLSLSEQPYQILLPSSYPSTRSVTTGYHRYHMKPLNGGGRVILATMLQELQHISERRLMNLIMQCYFRYTRTSSTPPIKETGQSPQRRIAQRKSSTVSSIDYGPAYLKPRHIEGLYEEAATTIKKYLYPQLSDIILSLKAIRTILTHIVAYVNPSCRAATSEDPGESLIVPLPEAEADYNKQHLPTTRDSLGESLPSVR